MDTIGDAIMRHLAAITNPGAILDKGNNPLGKDDLISLANSDYAYVRCNGKFLMSCELGSWLVYDMSKFSDEDIDILTGDDVSDPCLFDNDLQGRVERNHGIFVMQLANLHE